jgi:Carboxypeptidase regulatory-like domain
MRFFRFQNAVLGLSLLAFAGVTANTMSPVAFGQTNTTGDVAGIVSDSSGAIVPGAALSLTSLATGATRSTTSNSSGEYRFSQLSPGRYTISVSATGFERAKDTIDVSAGSIAPANIALTVGKASETVEVSAGEVPLIHVDDAQISSTFTQEQVQNLPNPGNDLTFVAQTAPGSVMNTQSGYGNFSSFGLPGTANTFTVNGGYYDDPFLNLNNSGATNLTLGNNDVASVTVTSNAYNASFGGLGGAQVSEISRSGGNKFHGNAAYWWNGRAMNADDYFDKQAGNPRPFDNVNQWAAGFGGPIIKDKTFFFVNYEGLRVVLPTRSTVYAPDPSYEQQTLANLTANGLASEIPGYQNIFSLYTSNPNYANATVSTPDTPTNPYGTLKFNGEAGNFTHEYKINGRIDQTLGSQDHLFGHMTYDNGVQATYTSVLNPLFNALSPQPAWDGQLGEQHIFSPSLSNSFLFATNWYQAVFSNTSEAASEKLSPLSMIFLDGDLGNNGPGAWPGGENFAFPQGRDVTGYQFQDDLSWTKGKHTLSVGWDMRRDDITDYSPQEFTSSPEVLETNASFQQGYVDYWAQNFPTRLTQPVALYGMGWYIQDQWRTLPNLTLTYGLRMEHNSNPVCRTACFARLSADFANVSTDPTTPYNQLISSGLSSALASLQKIGYEPRLGFDYLPFGPQSHTTVRGGFGMFADAFPGQIADSFLNNAPTNVPFSIYGPAFGGNNNALIPTSPGSAASVAAASNAGFVAGFAGGGSNSTGLPAPNISNAVQKIYNPSYAEWSMAIEQQAGKRDSFTIMYVGNHSYHEPELNNGVNAYNGGGAAGFPELPAAPPNPNFGAVTEVSSSSAGNFNGVVFSESHRARDLTLTVNYQYSHALDEISNGGFDPFGNNSNSPDDPYDLRKSYGNADYDTRHYVSGSYIYSLPHYRGPKVLVDNWQFAGTVFHSTGLPFSVTDSSTASAIGNYGGPLYAKQIAPLSGHNHCGGTGAANEAAPSLCGFTADFQLEPTPGSQSATDFGQSRRNQMFGPNYTDSDFSISKGFTMPGWDSGKLRVGAQFFNLFNHPNFAQPLSNVSGANYDNSGNLVGGFGVIENTVNPPTSILGSFLGGNASPRLIQLNAKFDF